MCPLSDHSSCERIHGHAETMREGNYFDRSFATLHCGGPSKVASLIVFQGQMNWHDHLVIHYQEAPTLAGLKRYRLQDVACVDFSESRDWIIGFRQLTVAYPK